MESRKLRNRINFLPTKSSPETRKRREKNLRYLRRLCAVSVNYAKGDSPRRLFVDVDVERRYLHVAPDSRTALYSLDEFSEGKGEV